jgi:competence protein ComGC
LTNFPWIREDYINEDDKLRKLLAANFGRLKNNPVKQGKVYSEYERLSGVRQGSAGCPDTQNVGRITQEQIALELGVSTETIRRLKKLQTLSPELQQLIEDGSVKYTTALNVYAKLSPTEQSQLIEELGKDKIAEMTQRQTEQYLIEKKALEQSFNDLSKKYSDEVNKVPVTVEVDNTDYVSISKLEQEKKSLLNNKEFQDKKLINLSEQLDSNKGYVIQIYIAFISFIYLTCFLMDYEVDSSFLYPLLLNLHKLLQSLLLSYVLIFDLIDIYSCHSLMLFFQSCF